MSAESDFREILELVGIRNAPLLIPSDSIALHPDVAYSTNADDEVIGISLCGCKLTELPAAIQKFSQLRVLRLFRNELQDLPTWIASLQSLEAIYLGKNKLHKIPNGVFEIENLKILGLNENYLSSAPRRLSQMRSLTTLGLGKNHLTEDGLDSVAELPELQYLYVSNNSIREIRSSVLKIKSLRSVDFSANPITFIPYEIDHLVNLENIKLDKIPLAQLPESIFSIKNLRRLSVVSSALSELPHIANASSLEWLDISNTRMSNIPPEIRLLGNLKFLGCANLHLTSFPREVLDLNGLAHLDLSSNRIGVLPVDILKLSKLQVLQLPACGLKEVPSELFQLPMLKHLDLRGNQIVTIPRSAIIHSTISGSRPKPPSRHNFFPPYSDLSDTGLEVGCFVGGNPLQSPPYEVINLGHQSIVNYYDSISDSQPVNEVKVLLVGDGASGKTSLAKAILDIPFDPQESQTHGIEIRDFSYETEGRTFIAHLWDFGGQEIMHATHQFFLSRRSIYILVLDGRREEKTEYWLKLIETFGANSPVILVITKVDENPSFDVNRKFLKEKYPAIKNFMRVSSRTRIGVKQLTQELRSIARQVESAQTLWPSSWFLVKRDIEKSNLDYISIGAFNELCNKHAIHLKEHRRTLIQFLHDLGVVLNFTDLPLRDTSVINPRWITDGVYRLVNSPDVAMAGGALDVLKLVDILDLQRHPPDKHNFIVELMKKFELCYSISAEKVLLPGLLPVAQPEFRFPLRETTSFRLKYEFLPKSVLPRFVVRMHDDIENGVSWRTGVVLANIGFGTRALIRADEEEARIDITVAGEQRRDYLGILIHTFRQINQSFQGINCVENVPIPEEPLITVSYEHLLRLERNGVKEYFPDGPARPYSVGMLLGHVQPALKSDEEILTLLRALHAKGDSEQSLLRKANQAVVLKPNFFGVGIDLNKTIEFFIKTREKK